MDEGLFLGLNARNFASIFPVFDNPTASEASNNDAKIIANITTFRPLPLYPG
jgi:hypothetical protein